MSPETRRLLGALVSSALRDLAAYVDERQDAATRAAGRNPHSIAGKEGR